MNRDLVFDGDGFFVDRIVTAPLDNNVYLITCRQTNEALLVDAASDPEAIIAFASQTKVTAVVATHGHWDHHGAIPEVTDTLDVPFLLHPSDEEIAGKKADAPLAEGFVTIGAVRAEMLHTPGHTPGSMCISLDGVVMTGDTLFPGGPGATRFEHSSFETIITSITERLLSMPDDTVVLPGHGEPTTIGTERPQLPAWVERGW